MKVLHVYAGNLFGGIETFLVTLAKQRHLCPQMEPHFALCFEGRLAEELRSAGVEVHLLGAVRFSRPWTMWRSRRHLGQLLQNMSPDVVICHESWIHYLASPVIRRFQLPLVFWMHGWGTNKHWYQRLGQRTPPDLAIANSHYTNKTLPELFPGHTGYVLYYPVASMPSAEDRSTIKDRVRESLQTSQNATVILMTSRMVAYKGHLLLIEALGQLQELPGWVLWMAGGPQKAIEREYFAKLKATALAKGISDRVKFLGDRSDIPHLLMASDIHCQPNIGPEPFGISFIEALYAGLPVVTSSIGAAVEIVNDTCGILVPPKDLDALAEALAKLIKNPEKRSSLGSAGPERARELCEPAKIMGQLQEVLASVT
jgi:glycosyltransferase involved in cell wall biosynthesis